jgi:hypothetical protein
VIRQPFPNLADPLIGSIYVVLGLTLFVKGLVIFPAKDGHLDKNLR